MGRMRVREILRQPGFASSCVGLAFCLCVRDIHQFALFDAVRGSGPAQYLLAAGRALPLLVLALLCTRAAHAKARNLPNVGWACIIGGAFFETVGRCVQMALAQDIADVWGLATLGLGESLLVCGWACWLIGLRHRELFIALIGSFTCAGAIEALMALVHSGLMGCLLLVFPLCSLGLFAIAAKTRRGAGGPAGENSTAQEKPGAAPEASGAPRAILTLFTFFAYSFIARQLADTWMERLTDEPLFLFQFFAALGTILAAGIVYLAFSLRRSYKNPAMYTVFVAFIVCLALYFSLTFTGHLGALCLVPLFALRKMLLFLPIYFARGFSQGTQGLRAFCLAMFFVELGNLFQTAFFEIMSFAPWGLEIAGSLSMLACMAYIVFVEWSQFFKIEKVDVFAENLASPADSMAKAVARMSQEYGLSSRETEVLTCLASGRNAEYVARTLGIAPSTAKTHIAHIYRKTGFNSQQRLMDALSGEGAGEGRR